MAHSLYFLFHCIACGNLLFLSLAGLATTLFDIVHTDFLNKASQEQGREDSISSISILLHHLLFQHLWLFLELGLCALASCWQEWHAERLRARASWAARLFNNW